MAKRQRDMFDVQREALMRQQAPLAARMRPTSFEEFVGQTHILGEGHVLRRSIANDQLFSFILWGPPGSGKTTLASLIAVQTGAAFEMLSAVNAGTADIRRVVQEANDRLGIEQRRTVLFLDEIHRFNKAQQDALLPVVEDGTIILIGATTENPSFEVNPALLSRMRVFTLEALSVDDLGQLIERAIVDEEHGLGKLNVVLATDARNFLLASSGGDARAALNTLEAAALAKAPALGNKRLITLDDVRSALQTRAAYYDKHGDLHYNAISALHKSVRDSDPDASLYWLARMLDGGEDPMYIARRLVRIAVEDVGMADPHALPLTIAAQQTVHFLGQPEGDLALAQAVVYLCQAPKSNRVYVAHKAALKDAKETSSEGVPLHLRNAPTGLMRELGYGRGYEYAPDLATGRSEQTHFPPALEGRIYYDPTDNGFEQTVRERFAWRDKKRAQRVEQRQADREPPRATAPEASYSPGEEPQVAPDDLPPADIPENIQRSTRTPPRNRKNMP